MQPPTIVPGSPAVSPPITTSPAGEVRRRPVKVRAAVFDAATFSLVVRSDDGLTVMPLTGGVRKVAPTGATGYPRLGRLG